MASGIVVSISMRTTRPNFVRRCSTSSIASSRSSSSSSSSKSVSRVTRNGWLVTMSMPGNRRSRCAAITCSIGTNRVSSASGRNRGRTGGTFTRAKRSSPVCGSRTCTARLSDRFEMYGNGCDGSTASGVSTGNIWASNTAASSARSAGVRSSQLAKRMSASSRAGAISLRNVAACRARQLIGVRAHGAQLLAGVEAVGGAGADAGVELLLKSRDADLEVLVEVLGEDGEELRPLEQRLASGPRPSASTRALKSSHESSRFRNRQGSRAGIVVGPQSPGSAPVRRAGLGAPGVPLSHQPIVPTTRSAVPGATNCSRPERS